MKVWRVTLDDNTTVDIPAVEVLDPEVVAANRGGYGIYEALDAKGSVLYTGRTKNLESRLRTHSTQSPWWAFARSVRWLPCSDYAESVALERIGISNDLGEWNIAGRAELPASGRMTLPLAACVRLRSLYANTDRPFGDPDLDNYICSLRHAGWTLQAIASPLEITRERVRQRAERGVVDHDLTVPSPPAKTARSRRKVWATLTDRQAQELRETYEVGRMLRGRLPLDHPTRVASERTTELIVEAKMRGVRNREIADVLGLTVGAINMRLKNHGYLSLAPSMKGYGQTAETPARATHCRRGHAFDGENVRYVNGDPHRRVCRACESIHVQKYRSKKAGAAA